MPCWKPDHSGREDRTKFRRRLHRYGTGADHDHAEPVVFPTLKVEAGGMRFTRPGILEA